MKKQWIVAVLAAIMVVGIGMPVQAAGDWKIEVAPYIWATGMSGDLTTADGHEAEFDYSFSDLSEKLDLSAELLAVVQYKQFVGFVQGDYFRLKEDEFDQPAAQEQLDEITMSTTLLTMAAGYQFPTIKDSWVDVMGGVRVMSLRMEADLVYAEDRDETHTITDAILVLRPNFHIWKGLRFNPTLSIGAGSSDLVYELQPQFEYNFSQLLGVRLGYRTLHYKYTTDRETELNIGFSGPMLGVTFNF